MTTETRQVRIVIADDFMPMRWSLSRLLKTYPQCILVGEASNGAEAVKLCKEEQPDVVLLDLDMPVMNGAEAAAEILARHPQTVVIGITGDETNVLIEQLQAVGGRRCIFKTMPAALIMETIYEELAK